MPDTSSPDFSMKVEEPSEFSTKELDEFAHLISTGGKVSMVGLPGRLRNAHLLATLRTIDAQLLAAAGLKHPEVAYRARVSRKSSVSIPCERYPLELGWVVVQPSAQGGKSLLLCSALIRSTPGQGVFATTGTENRRMQSTLGKLGFKRERKVWDSVEGDEQLCLFTLSR
ncbi:hypothetical protein [Variovorax paradoxus]|jgi:hypothetical protein|uniref:hypothetical protein n=1 Tax=Variovorax paradoxus TaxID=34073 RepID=UPI003395328E